MIEYINPACLMNMSSFVHLLESSTDQTSSNMPHRVTRNAIQVHTRCQSGLHAQSVHLTAHAPIVPELAQSVACCSSLPCQLHTSTITISMPGRLSLDFTKTRHPTWLLSLRLEVGSPDGCPAPRSLVAHNCDY